MLQRTCMRQFTCSALAIIFVLSLSLTAPLQAYEEEIAPPPPIDRHSLGDSSMDVTVTRVAPVPIAAYGGLLLLSGMGATRYIRRRRA